MAELEEEPGFAEDGILDREKKLGKGDTGPGELVQFKVYGALRARPKLRPVQVERKETAKVAEDGLAPAAFDLDLGPRPNGARPRAPVEDSSEEGTRGAVRHVDRFADRRVGIRRKSNPVVFKKLTKRRKKSLELLPGTGHEGDVVGESQRHHPGAVRQGVSHFWEPRGNRTEPGVQPEEEFCGREDLPLADPPLHAEAFGGAEGGEDAGGARAVHGGEEAGGGEIQASLFVGLGQGTRGDGVEGLGDIHQAEVEGVVVFRGVLHRPQEGVIGVRGRLSLSEAELHRGMKVGRESGLESIEDYPSEDLKGCLKEGDGSTIVDGGGALLRDGVDIPLQPVVREDTQGERVVEDIQESIEGLPRE